MLRIDVERKKLLNAILYFAKNVKHPTKTKIYKLLFFLDFRHFKEIGRSVTGLTYFTWNYGPVPKKLHEEIEQHGIPKGFETTLRIVEEESDEDDTYKTFRFRALKPPNLNVFSERETRILEEIALIYKDVTASMISEISHLKNEPWAKTLQEKGENAEIDYLLALDQESKIDEETAKDRIREHEEIVKLFGTMETN